MCRYMHAKRERDNDTVSRKRINDFCFSREFFVVAHTRPLERLVYLWTVVRISNQLRLVKQFLLLYWWIKYTVEYFLFYYNAWLLCNFGDARTLIFRKIDYNLSIDCVFRYRSKISIPKEFQTRWPWSMILEK